MATKTKKAPRKGGKVFYVSRGDHSSWVRVWSARPRRVREGYRSRSPWGGANTDLCHEDFSKVTGLTVPHGKLFAVKLQVVPTKKPKPKTRKKG